MKHWRRKYYLTLLNVCCVQGTLPITEGLHETGSGIGSGADNVPQLFHVNEPNEVVERPSLRFQGHDTRSTTLSKGAKFLYLAPLWSRLRYDINWSKRWFVLLTLASIEKKKRTIFFIKPIPSVSNAGIILRVEYTLPHYFLTPDKLLLTYYWQQWTKLVKLSLQIAVFIDLLKM